MVLQEQHGLGDKLVLKLGERAMIDPFSLCDFPELKMAGQVPEIVVEKA
jgi:hypothetical protein